MHSHDLDPISLLFGLIYTGLAAMLGLIALGASVRTTASLALPALLIVAGCAGLATHRRSDR
jgi:hypothetical protein